MDDLDDEEKDAPELEEPDIDILELDRTIVSQFKKREGNMRIGTNFLGTLAINALIAKRVGLLDKGSNPTVKLTSKMYHQTEPRLQNNVAIAKAEIMANTIPLKIIKKFPDGYIEEWYISDFKRKAKMRL